MDVKDVGSDAKLTGRSADAHTALDCFPLSFTKIRAIARENGMAFVAEASNVDDNGDYRPGLRAVAEQGIRSPLREAGLTKAEIREYSRQMGLPTWNKQSFACLSSRVV